jgi:regulator of cell morphogenesis and NO signaling
MTTADQPIHADQTVAELASTRSGASRVFHRHGLDFCCGGHVSLADACTPAGLDVDALIAEIQAEATKPGSFERWDEHPLPDVIDHILTRFHEPHREELPRLLAMARKVEDVHGAKPTCPKGLADHLQRMHAELEEHMQKEEQILFPMLRAGRGRMAAMPVGVMEEEHRDHGKNLERLRELTNGYTPPAEACGTWTALYLGLAEFEREIMEHIHTENNILFPRALRS